jgi:mannitol-1-phosphate 5-dehydrogenase
MIMTVQPNRPSIVIIGAGATGRGQIGQLACDSGWDVTYIERRIELVDCLREAGRFSVGLAGEKITEIEVTGFTILHTDDTDECSSAIANADIVATAVLPTNLASTVPTLAAGLDLRERLGVEKPLNVIACENMERSSSTLHRYLQESTIRSQNCELQSANSKPSWVDAHIGFPDSMVARAVPVPDDPLILLAEGSQEWSVDASGVKEPMPRLQGMTLSENQAAALERKLYIKNTGHMSIGILGFLKGYQLMDEATRDPEVFSLVDAATQESAQAVASKHGFASDFMEEYRSTFLEQMKSPFLPDDIKRVIREPIRKLEREERLVGPAMLCFAQGQIPRALARVIANLLTIVNPADPQSMELQSILKRNGVEAVLEEKCGIPREHPLMALIAEAYANRK